MPTCLLGLGANVADREATLRKAIAEIDALPDVRVARQSSLHRSKPAGGPAGQGEFLNAAVVAATSIPSLSLLDELQDIESRHGRQRGERWGPRTLDIDLLLYDSEVSETEMLTLPHPRMAFRRFVLEPAAEVAPRMLHPVVGWPVQQLLLHLNSAADQVAVVSPSQSLRESIGRFLVEKCGAGEMQPPQFERAEQLWPAAMTKWVSMGTTNEKTDATPTRRGGVSYAGAALPKLSILLDSNLQSAGAVKSQWSALVRKPGRGPMLRMQTDDEALIKQEVQAAVEAVWPDLGRSDANRLK